MVLPASAPDDAPRPHEPAWIERLKVILRLADRGVIVLVDGGRPERLGELVRGLARAYPDIEVHGDARRLARAQKSAVVVLVPDPAQADWLNLERPVVAHRELRLILFSDAGTSAHLARQAVDFFHWISHRIECPPGAVMPAVRTIRRALCGRAHGIAWCGGDLEGAMGAALPGRSLSVVPATLPYGRLVEAARPSGRSWVGFSGVESAFWLRRVRWALAEAGRRGRAVLIEASGSLPGFWPVHGKLMPLSDAVKSLEAAGAANAGRLAAMLDLEPEAVEIARELLLGGVEEGAIEGVAARAEDPGAEVAKLSIGREPEARKGSPVLMRAVGELPAMKSQSKREKLLARIERAQRDAASKPDALGFLANAAIHFGDPEVAERWSRAWLARGSSPPKARCLLGLSLFHQGELASAAQVFGEAEAFYEQEPDSNPTEHARVLAGLGQVLHARAHLREAEKYLRKSLSLAQRAPRANQNQIIDVTVELADVLFYRWRDGDARALLGQIPASIELNWLQSLQFSRALGHWQLLYGDASGAEVLFREQLATIEKTFGKEHPLHAKLLGDLGRALVVQRKYAEAEVVLRRALAAREQLRRRVSWDILEPLSDALMAQGKYALADRALRKAVADAEHDQDWVAYAGALIGLGRSLISRGRFAESESVYRQALDVATKSLEPEHVHHEASLYGVAKNALEQGRAEEAEPMLAKVLAIEEKAYGRENPVLSSVLRDLANAAADQGRLVDAERFARRSLHLAEQSRDQDEVAQTLKRMALVQAEMNRQDATDTARRAIHALAIRSGVQDSVISNVEPELQAILDRASRRGKA